MAKITKKLDEKEGNESNSRQDREKEEGDKPPGSDLPPIDNEPAGLTVEGDWEEISDFCEQLNYTLEDEKRWHELPAEDLKNWKTWFPAKEENSEKVKKRSASLAAYRPENSPKDDLKKSATHLDTSRESIDAGKKRRALEELTTAAIRAFRGILTQFGKLLGKAEHLVYRYIITKTNSSYFDSQSISANLENKGDLVKDDKYRMQIKIHDKDLRERVSEILRS